MNILSQDGKKLINYDNVASLYIQEVYQQYVTPNKHWEIRVMYPAVSEDILYDKIAEFNNKEKCEDVFKDIVHQICNLRYNFIRVGSI